HGYPDFGPFFAGDAQLVGQDDVGNIPRNEHATADDETHQKSDDGLFAHGRADHGGSQCGVVQNGRNDVDPIEDVRMEMDQIFVDQWSKTGPKEDKARHEQIHFDRPDDNFFDRLVLSAFIRELPGRGRFGRGQCLFHFHGAAGGTFEHDGRQNAEGQHAGYDVNADDAQQIPETFIQLADDDGRQRLADG